MNHQFFGRKQAILSPATQWALREGETAPRPPGVDVSGRGHNRPGSVTVLKRSGRPGFSDLTVGDRVAGSTRGLWRLWNGERASRRAVREPGAATALGGQLSKGNTRSHAAGARHVIPNAPDYGSGVRRWKSRVRVYGAIRWPLSRRARRSFRSITRFRKSFDSPLPRHGRSYPPAVSVNGCPEISLFTLTARHIGPDVMPETRSHYRR
jgi:hypothetical protein